MEDIPPAVPPKRRGESEQEAAERFEREHLMPPAQGVPPPPLTQTNAWARAMRGLATEEPRARVRAPQPSRKRALSEPPEIEDPRGRARCRSVSRGRRRVRRQPAQPVLSLVTSVQSHQVAVAFECTQQRNATRTYMQNAAAPLFTSTNAYPRDIGKGR